MFINQKNIYRDKGFTLIELLVTLAIAGIVLGLAAPSFSTSIRNSRLTSNINTLVATLNFARSEAIKRNQSVTVKRVAGAGTGVWEQGWIVFVDVDGDGDGIAEADASDVNDEILRNYGAMPVSYTLRSTINRVTFRPSGISATSRFILCDNADGNNTVEANTARLMLINGIGRVRMGRDTNGDGIQEVAGTNITACT